MLHIDVSHYLSMLSAICQSPHVFVFEKSELSASFHDEFEQGKPDIKKAMLALNFTQLRACLGAEYQLDMPASTRGEVIKDDAYLSTAIYAIPKTLNNIQAELYLCPVFTSTNKLSIVDILSNTVEDEDNSLLRSPDIILGLLIFSDSGLSRGVKSGLLSLAHVLEAQIKQTDTVQTLEQSEVLFKEISTLNKDYIYVKDASGKVIFANQSIVSLFPTSSYQDVLALELENTFEQDLDESIEEINNYVRLEGEHKRVDTINAPDGTMMVLETVTQRFHANRQTWYLLVVSRDITEREVIIKDLKRSNQDLDNFAYVASHDLKAPLNVIKRLVSWVMEDCADILPADSLDDLSLVMSRANRMEQLLQDLLTYARIGKDYQQPKKLNVKDKVVELLALIDLPMGFAVKCDDAFINVPEVPFGVVLLNLISNAIKHHDSGNAKIQIKVRKNQQSNVITVIDNGPGIATENKARIFELFETLKPRDEVEGSGMGLSVVKRLVEHYGGHIKVEDHRPRGTKFVVYWPFKNLAEQVLTQLS